MQSTIISNFILFIIFIAKTRVKRNQHARKTPRNASRTPRKPIAIPRQIMKFLGEEIKSAKVTFSIIAPSCPSTFS